MKLNNKNGNAAVWIIIAILAVLIAFGIWRWKSPETSVPTTNGPASDLTKDTISDIQSDIESVDIGADLEEEMNKQLDADINSL